MLLRAVPQVANAQYFEVGKGGIFCYHKVMYHVYILFLSNNQQYVGFTENLKNRLIDHREGKCETTAKYRPVKLIWCCLFSNKKKALEFEKYLKSGSGTEFRRRHF